MLLIMKKNIITIAGKPGSGKSTTAKQLAKKLGFKHFSSGDLFRRLGKERGVDVLKTNLMAETEKEIDYLVDQKLQDLGEGENKLVVDSRMAWHWMPYSFKVYLDLDLEIAAERIIGEMSLERILAEHIPGDSNAYAKILKERLDSENRRYLKLYNQNPYNLENYDLVVDTNLNNVAEVIELIESTFTNWLTE